MDNRFWLMSLVWSDTSVRNEVVYVQTYHQHWQKYKKTAFEYLFTVVTTMRERVKAAKQPPLLVDVILKNKKQKRVSFIFKNLHQSRGYVLKSWDVCGLEVKKEVLKYTNFLTLFFKIILQIAAISAIKWKRGGKSPRGCGLFCPIPHRNPRPATNKISDC